MHEAFGERMQPAETLAKHARRRTAWAGRTAAGSTAIATDTRPVWTERSTSCSGVRPGEAVDTELVERRLVYVMLNEAAAACSEQRGAERPRRRHRRDLRHRIPRVPRRSAPHDRRPRRGSGRRDAARSPGRSSANGSGRPPRWPRWPGRAAATIRPERVAMRQALISVAASWSCPTSACWSSSGSTNPACSTSPAPHGR